jgi:hypothetical protein
MLPPFCSREEQDRFPQQCGWEFDLLHSGFSFLSWLTPLTPERGITWPKVCRLAKSAKLTDLQGDSEQEQRSLNHAASMALPASWYAGSFLARRTIHARLGRYERLYKKDPEDVPTETSGSTMPNRARFRACAFSTAGSIVSLRDVRLRRGGQPQPNCTP